MITAGIKVFFRHLLKKKLLTLINILGLSVGLSSVLLLTLYVQDEMAKDHQHPAAEYKYRIGTVITTGGEVLEADRTAPPAVPLLQANFSEITEGTRYFRGRFYVSTEEGDGQGFYEDRIGFADTTIGSFFSFLWKQGNPETAWKERNSIVLTESLAQKYFPQGAAVGKVLLLDNSLALTVTGIIRDPTLDSHIDLQAIAPMEAASSLRPPDFLQSWFNLEFFSYVRLQPGVEMAALWPAMAALIESNMPDMARQLFDPSYTPLTDVYLDTTLNPGMQRTRFDDVRMLIGISLAILLIACINFVNLATARSVDRQKEIAIRKVTGAGQRLIFAQYMLESCCLVLLALLLAMGITELSLPLVNGFTEKQLSLATAGDFWLLALGIGVATTLLAGAYPAFYLSGFRPLLLFRQKQKAAAGFFSLRNLLVLFQFAIAIAV
ncbi:MAG TPA: ABC transporter permease, partial [Hyphomicrobiales bacterium]|nr:ABC transporter permease [Hyphomicrobiales bacterium]